MSKEVTVVDKVTARDIFCGGVDDAWNLRPGYYEVLYEDGVSQLVKQQDIIMDRTIWIMFEVFPNTPITHDMTVVNVIGDGFYNESTHKKLMERIFKYICDYNNLRSYESKEVLIEVTYLVYNRIFNDIVHRASPFVAGMDATDIVNLVKRPEVQSVLETIDDTPESVDKGYKAIGEFVKTTDYDNPIIDAVRCGSARVSAFNQGILVRGFVTDLDRSVFSTPIKEGFMYGIHTLYGIMTESRTAGKAYNAAGASIQKSEYASRRFQLMTMSVERAIFGDCGSQQYLDVFMNPRYLKNFVGKWYLDEETGELKDLKGTETHLLDKVVKFRTIFGCQIPSRHNVCTTCLGRTSENFKSNTNLGAIASQTYMESVTQGLLSLKHLVQSVGGAAVDLDENSVKYFYGTDKGQIFLNENKKLLRLSIVLDGVKLYKLGDVLSVDAENIPLANIGGIDRVAFKTPDGVLIEEVSIGSEDMPATLTKAFLEHVKKSDFQVDESSNYVVPLEGWNIHEAMFEIPPKEPDMSAFLKIIEGLIEGTDSKRLTLKEHFFKLVNTVLERSNCNVVILEIMTYAITAYNLELGNLRQGRMSPDMQYTKRKDLHRGRSISQFLIFEKQMPTMRSEPHLMFPIPYPQRHPADALFMPNEAVKDYDERFDKVTNIDIAMDPNTYKL